MSVDRECIAFSDMVHINPPTRTGGLSRDELVSFIPMADVSESGEWTSRQARPLKSVATGYTPFIERDVLFAKITPCMENGKGAHAIDLVNDRGFGSTEFHVLRARTSHHDRFIFYWTRSRRFRTAAEAFMIGSAGQQRVQPTFFEELHVPSLSCEEQRRVAVILDTLGETICKTKQVIDKLKQMKQGLLHDLLTRGVDANGELRNLKRNPEKFKDYSPLGWIPRGWNMQPLGEVLTLIRNGTSAPQQAELTPYPVTRIETIADGTIDWGRVGYLQVSAPHYEMRAGDILYSHINSYAHMGKVALFDGAGTLYHGMNLMLLRCDPRQADPRFVHFVLDSEIGRSHARRESKSAINQASLSQGDIKRLLIPIPPIDEQKRIIIHVSEFEATIAQEELLIQKLRALKQGLMDDLLTGRLRVSV